MTQRKRMKRVISIILVLCITISMMPSVVFADATPEAEKKTVNYVSLGDSMTNGYCFTGYRQGEITEDEFRSGEGVYGDVAYPNLFAEWLEYTYGVNVNHKRLAVSAVRAEDLNYLLGGRDCPDDYDGWFRDIRHYSGVRDDEILQEIYQDAITGADIISMSIGNASFGAYLVDYLGRLLGIVGEDLRSKVNLEEALAVLPSEKKAAIMQVYNQIYNAVKDLIPSRIGGLLDTQSLIDMIEYISVGFLLNYEEVLEDIIKLNPNVEIMLVGLMNTTYGITIKIDDSNSIPLGDILNAVYGILNTYVAGLPTVKQAAGQWKKAKFYYAEVPNPEYIVQKFGEMAQANWPNDYQGLSGAVVRDRTITAYNNTIKDMVGKALGMNLSELSIDDVKDYTPGDNYRDENPENIAIETSASIYLALEDALAACVGTMDITLDGLMGLANGLLNAMGPMPTIASPTPKTIHDELFKWFTGSETNKGICKIFAMIMVGNGMSVHPTPNAHKDVTKKMIEAYTNKHMAKDELLETIGEDALWIYNNFEQAKVIVDFAAGQGWLNSDQAKQINDLLTKLAELRDSGKIEEALNTAKKIAKILKTATGVSIVVLSTASITATINKIVSKRKENINKVVWDKDYTIDVAPTCTEAGMKSIHGRDGVSVKDAEVIPATGHSYGEWMLDTENTATAKRVCANCGSGESKALKLKLTAKAAKKKITLSWNSVIGAEKYVVYAAKSGGKLKKLSTVEATDKDSYKKTVKKVAGKTLVAGKKYKFYVKALDSNGKQIVKSTTKQLKAA